MVFFTVEEVFLFWCCIKNLQCRSARFFCASSTDLLFGPKLACSHLFGQENISRSRQKNIIHRYWSKKMTVDIGQKHDRSRSKKEASSHDSDRIFPYDIMPISLRDWIENSIADIGREVARLIFFSWHCAIFFKNARWPIMFFFYGRGGFLVDVLLKNIQCRSTRFFCASSTDVLFWPQLACFHLFGLENISPSRQKDIFHRYWSKKMPVDVGQERWPIEVYKWCFTGWCRSNISLPTSCIFHWGIE